MRLAYIIHEVVAWGVKVAVPSPLCDDKELEISWNRKYQIIH